MSNWANFHSELCFNFLSWCGNTFSMSHTANPVPNLRPGSSGPSCSILLLVLKEQLQELQAALLASILDMEEYKRGCSSSSSSGGLTSPLEWMDGLLLLHNCPPPLDRHLLRLLGCSVVSLLLPPFLPFLTIVSSIPLDLSPFSSLIFSFFSSSFPLYFLLPCSISFLASCFSATFPPFLLLCFPSFPPFCFFLPFLFLCYFLSFFPALVSLSGTSSAPLLLSCAPLVASLTFFAPPWSPSPCLLLTLLSSPPCLSSLSCSDI